MFYRFSSCKVSNIIVRITSRTKHSRPLASVNPWSWYNSKLLKAKLLVFNTTWHPPSSLATFLFEIKTKFCESLQSNYLVNFKEHMKMNKNAPINSTQYSFYIHTLTFRSTIGYTSCKKFYANMQVDILYVYNMGKIVGKVLKPRKIVTPPAYETFLVYYTAVSWYLVSCHNSLSYRLLWSLRRGM